MHQFAKKKHGEVTQLTFKLKLLMAEMQRHDKRTMSKPFNDDSEMQNIAVPSDVPADLKDFKHFVTVVDTKNDGEVKFQLRVIVTDAAGCSKQTDPKSMQWLKENKIWIKQTEPKTSKKAIAGLMSRI